jgi:copper chaperone NosL
LLAGILLPGCSPEPRIIDYGHDVCDFCKMTIVELQYGAEVVTTKGRVYVFDAIECMVHFTQENSDMKYAHVLVNHYTNPGVLNDATKSTYLISEALPSPMGAFLNALPGTDEAATLQSDKGGEIYSWDELIEKLTR